MVDVPRETMASSGRSGRARIVDGLSPVKGAMPQSLGKPYLSTKYGDIAPMLPPPSFRTVPSFCLSDSTPSSPAASLRSGSCHSPALMSQRFIPQTSLISKGAILPRNTDARNEDTSVMREVAL